MTTDTSDWLPGWLNPPPAGPVTPAVTDAVTPPVTQVVTPPVTGGVTPGGENPGGGDTVTLSPLPVGEWEEAGAEPDSGGGLAAVIRRLSALGRGSDLLGAGGLAAEIRDPHPDTTRQHLSHVRSHHRRPAHRAWGLLFIAGHLAVTGPVKITGEAMEKGGNSLAWAGKRTSRAGDHFTSAVIFLIVAAIVIPILVVIIGDALSYLP